MSQKLCELEALICEREGMIAINKFREMRGELIAYNEREFLTMADKFRALENCHHEEEKKGCGRCKGNFELDKDIIYSINGWEHKAKFCPECGRKL